MHALKHEALVLALERQNPLGAQDAWPLALHDEIDPRHEARRIDFAVDQEREGLHLLVVIMLQAVIMPVVMSMIVPVMIVVVDLQKRGLDFQNAVEIERVAAEHRIQRHGAAAGLVQFGVRVDGADARLHFAQFFRGHQIHLVEDDDVGKRDLVLGLGRIAQAVGQPFGVGHSHHGVKPGLILHVLIDKECLRDGGGIGQSRGLDDDRVELALAAH